MKRFLCFFMTVIFLFAFSAPALAASEEATKAAESLYELGLFKGKGTAQDGSPLYALDDTPTRQEAVTMLVRLLGKEAEAIAGTWEIPFTDVDNWAKPYVGYAYTNGITLGTGATTFGGKTPIKASEYITFVLRALGYKSGTDFQWDKAWELSDRLGITHNTYHANNQNDFLRADVALISYAALDAAVQPDGITLREKIGVKQNPTTSEIPLVKPNDMHDWRYIINLHNPGTTVLTLQQLRIVQRSGGENGTVYGAYLFDTAHLPNGLTENDGTPLQLAPGEVYRWPDGHPVVPDFDFVSYEFLFTQPDGTMLVQKTACRLSHEITYPSYANDNGRDLVTLRYDANYEVEVSEGIYWVPAVSLGKSDYTNAQVQAMLMRSPQEKQASINTLYEALQLYQIGAFGEANDNIRIYERGINWEHHKPGYHAVRTNKGCCATDSNWLRYILDGDYDEVGFIAYSMRDGNGHVFNYILQDGWYYIIDMTHYRIDFRATAVETGLLSDYYHSDIVLGNIHKTKDLQHFVDYVQNAFNDPPGLMFCYTAENCLALDALRNNGAVTIVYETADDVSVKNIFDDPADRLTYTFAAPPTRFPNWAAEPGFDFSVIK